MSTNRCNKVGMTSAVPTRGRRAPCAGRKSSERVEAVATRTPALRHTAAQHRGALYVRSAQAGLQVCLCDELRNAARHAACVGTIAPHVPLLKHRHGCVAVRRHAICQCKVRWSAAHAMLPWRSSGAQRRPVSLITVGTARFWAACTLSAPPLLRW
jgi:hypothetical protein